MVVQQPGCTSGFWKALADAGIKFDVWALSCIGAWVGIVYNQFGDEVKNKDRAKLTYEFFKDRVFRDDESYERFPINKVFGPDWRSNIKALNSFVTDRNNYRDFLWDPYRMMDVFQNSMELLFDQLPDRDQKKFKKLDEGDINRMDTQPSDGNQSLRPLLHIDDVFVQRQRACPGSTIRIANL